MTEQTLGSPAASTEAPAAPLESSVSTQSPSHEPSHAEKMVPQSEVGRIAGASRKEGHDKGYERGYQEAQSKFQQQQPSVQNESPGFQPKSQAEIQELVARQVAESLKREREEQNRLSEEKRVSDYMRNLTSQLKPKIEAAQEKYSDFNSKVAELHLEEIPRVLDWVNSVPNAGDVLYDLANNPHKLGILNSMHTPELAIRQIHEISRSLQNNQAAQDKTLPKGPLSTIEPSTVGKQSGEMSPQSVTDAARAKYRF